METIKNRRNVPIINETLLLNSLAEEGVVKELLEKTPEVEEKEKSVEQVEVLPDNNKEVREIRETKEPARRKRNPAGMDYGTQYLSRNEFKNRQCVYISQKIHTAISRIVNIISDKDITVGGYIDSILMEHLETHKEEITELYDKEYEKKSGKYLLNF